MQSIETRHGRLRGRRQDGLTALLGVPYARPPLGRLRFSSPRPPEPWSGVREADAFGPPPPQPAGMLTRMLGFSAEGAREDCLSLNVWTPGCDASRRPVLVWVHGGSFTSGAGSMPIYRGLSLARRGEVVLVTLNYRLGALGFLALPEVARRDGEAWASFGLEDVVLALRWVQEHVGLLGGDPRRVTLFGESAGAMAVASLLAAPVARDLFHRAVLQSGAADNVHDPEDAARVAHGFAKELGVRPDDRRALEEAPVEAILGAQERTLEATWRTIPGLAFQPTVDGRLLPEPPLRALRGGASRDRTLLIGTNRDEQKLWALSDARARTLDEAGLVRRLGRSLARYGGPEVVDEVIRSYRQLRPPEATTPRELWYAIETDRIFGAPAAALREAQLEALQQARGERAGSPGEVFAYHFDWASPVMDGALGSCHALEVPFVFGTLDQPVVRDFAGASPEARRLSECMQEAWAALARDADPSTPTLGAWPAYRPRSEGRRVVGRRAGDAGPGPRSVQVLGPRCHRVHDPEPELRRLWAGLRERSR